MFLTIYMKQMMHAGADLRHAVQFLLLFMHGPRSKAHGCILIYGRVSPSADI